MGSWSGKLSFVNVKMVKLYADMLNKKADIK